MANSYFNITGLAVQYGLNSALRTLFVLFLSLLSRSRSLCLSLSLALSHALALLSLSR